LAYRHRVICDFQTSIIPRSRYIPTLYRLTESRHLLRLPRIMKTQQSGIAFHYFVQYFLGIRRKDNLNIVPTAIHRRRRPHRRCDCQDSSGHERVEPGRQSSGDRAYTLPPSSELPRHDRMSSMGGDEFGYAVSRELILSGWPWSCDRDGRELRRSITCRLSTLSNADRYAAAQQRASKKATS